jgi:type II secretory pathway pseudopilin PulG
VSLITALLIAFAAAALAPIFAGVFREWNIKQRQRLRREHIAAVLEAQRRAWAYDIRVMGGSGGRR